MHAQVIIHDIDRFVSDLEHTGELTGSIDFAPFGMGIPASSAGTPAVRPTERRVRSADRSAADRQPRPQSL